MKGIVRFVVACGIAAISVGSAQAQSDSSLDEVVVTAKRLEEEIPKQLAQYGTHVDVITAGQIKNGGYIDVASALQALAPGLYISSQNGPFDYVQVSLQGSRTEDVLWLVDGIRINNRLYPGTTPLDTIPAYMIERIEVLDGGQALFYGTQAVAGAVNIVTKAFTDTPDGAVSVGGDTNNGEHFNGYYRDAIGGNHFVVAATRRERQLRTIR
jgi:outer membrane cobalamin receptor